MAYKFFHIGKANAEIDRLETLLADKERQIVAFEQAAPENLAALQDELASTKSQLDQANVSLNAANESLKALAAKDAEIAKLKADAVALEASVEQRASDKALAITQAQGQTKPVAAEVKPSTQSMTGAEFNKLSHAERNQFIRSGGRLTD